MNQQPDKAIVHYYADKGTFIKKGMGAMVYPVDHTSPHVSNSSFCHTSKVIRYDEDTGEFETQNSIYKPLVE